MKELELRILRNFIRMMPKTYRKRTMNRTVVRDILMAGTSTMGSNSCVGKCIELNIDPDGYEL